MKKVQKSGSEQSHVTKLKQIPAHDENFQLQIATPQRAKSHLIASNGNLQDVFRVICSFADADRQCVFCSRPCHTNEPCGSFLEPGYGAGVICQISDKKWLKPAALPSTPKQLNDMSPQTTPNIDLMIIKK